MNIFKKYIENKKNHYEFLKVQANYIKGEINFIDDMNFKKSLKDTDYFNELDYAIYSESITELEVNLENIIKEIVYFEHSVLGYFLIPKNDKFEFEEN